MATKLLKPGRPKSNTSSSRRASSAAPEVSVKTRAAFIQTHGKAMHDAVSQVKIKQAVADKLKPEVQKQKIICFEPTYRMEPSQERKFSPNKVEKIINATLPVHLNGVKYDAQTTPRLTCVVANAIKDEVMTLNFERYKYVCHVELGEKGGQGLQSASRGVMYEGLDSFAMGKFENDSLFATATVFGLFYD